MGESLGKPCNIRGFSHVDIKSLRRDTAPRRYPSSRLLGPRDRGYMELGTLAGEVHRVQLADAGVLRLVGEMAALVDGKAVDFAELVVNVGTRGLMRYGQKAMDSGSL